MSNDDLLILAGLAVGGYYIYSNAVKPFADVGNAISNTEKAISDGLNNAANLVFPPTPTAQTGTPTDDAWLNAWGSALAYLPSTALTDQANYDVYRSLMGTTANRWDWGTNVKTW